MVPSSAGAIVLVAFPFSDLTQTKVRPAVVLAGGGRGDWILCQITSNAYADARAVLWTTAASVPVLCELSAMRGPASCSRQTSA